MFALNLLAGDDSPAQGAAIELASGCPLDRQELGAYCRAALELQQLLDLEGVSHVEVSVQLFDTESMQALNEEYRHKNAATNVLSFASGLPVLHDDDNGALCVLGDLILCPSVIAAEAFEQNKSPKDHWAHLVVHGILHLCGYDHIDEAGTRSMETLEIAILSQSGVANPYLPCALND